jgi:hypothetical protein
MKAEKEIREESRRIRRRARALSGFWIAELAAGAYALEWALGKHPRPPSEDIGSTGSAQGKIAASLLKAAEQEAVASAKAGRKARTIPRPRRRPASR